MNSQVSASELERQTSEEANGEVHEVLARIFRVLQLLGSILLILASVYLAWQGNIR